MGNTAIQGNIGGGQRVFTHLDFAFRPQPLVSNNFQCAVAKNKRYVHVLFDEIGGPFAVPEIIVHFI